MNKNLKIALGILGLFILGVVVFIAKGLYGMEIEDTYGDNQDIFYNTRQGDIVVNHETKKLGEIKKTWKRFYVTNNLDTVDVDDWWDDKNIEIYEFKDARPSGRNLDYDDLETLKDEGKLELKKKLR